MGTILNFESPHEVIPYISPYEVDTRIGVMGKKLAHDFRNQNPVLLTVLNGGKTFGDKLGRTASANGLIYTSGTVGVSSYKGGTESNRKPAITSPLDVDIKGRNVVLREDIVDTGLTMKFLLAHLALYGPSSLSVVTLLHKPSREVEKISLYDIGFVIDNLFVVGEGIDFDEHYRTCSGIWIVEFLKQTAEL